MKEGEKKAATTGNKKELPSVHSAPTSAGHGHSAAPLLKVSANASKTVEVPGAKVNIQGSASVEINKPKAKPSIKPALRLW